MAKEKPTDDAKGNAKVRGATHGLDLSGKATNTLWTIPGGLKGLNDMDYNGPRPTGRKPVRGADRDR